MTGKGNGRRGCERWGGVRVRSRFTSSSSFTKVKVPVCRKVRSPGGNQYYYHGICKNTCLLNLSQPLAAQPTESMIHVPASEWMQHSGVRTRLLLRLGRRRVQPPMPAADTLTGIDDASPRHVPGSPGSDSIDGSPRNSQPSGSSDGISTPATICGTNTLDHYNFGLTMPRATAAPCNELVINYRRQPSTAVPHA